MTTSTGLSDFTRKSFAGDIALSIHRKRLFVVGSYSAAMRRQIVNPIADYDRGQLILHDARDLDMVSNIFHRRRTEVSRMVTLQAGYQLPITKRLSSSAAAGWTWSWTEGTIFTLNSNEGAGPPFYSWWDVPRDIDAFSFRLSLEYALTDRTHVGVAYMLTGAFSNADLRMISVRTALGQW
jgi:hypothetical protein